MAPDEEGFLYPAVNSALCVECDLCEKRCPVGKEVPAQKQKVSAAQHTDLNVRSVSSSGGVFTALARDMLARGGVVFGAAFDENLRVEHVGAFDETEIASMRGSKYVQSDMYDTYSEVRQYLQEGRRVMFTGTPCQVAGLNGYLGGNNDNLVTVDIACHGVPGPGLWEMYVKALGKRAGADVKDADFRDKSRGWRHYVFKTTYASGSAVCVTAADDPYMALFMQDMTLRPSCYSCPAKGGRSHSDLTLADLWSVAKAVPEMNDDKGVSGVLVNTEKGRRLFERIQTEYKQEVPVEDVKSENGGFAESLPIPEKRAEFFEGLKVIGVDVYNHIAKYVVKKPLIQRVLRRTKSTLSSIKRRILK
jgi:coenzyme F420-reducing hydrogenase beta subunit